MPRYISQMHDIMIQNDLLIRVLKGERVERTPVWMMRQAGRVLPEYRLIRDSTSGFVEFVKNPDLAAEVTIQPVDILGVDAAIIFSDILVIPEAMGLPYVMVKGKGPFFPKTISSEKDLKNLHKATPDDLGYVIEAIKRAKRGLQHRVPLIGFAGAPWTIFCYMVEGHGSKTFSKARKMLYQAPTLSHRLLQLITESTISYLKAQIKAGVDLVQVFDSWAGVLPKNHFLDFSLKYITQICDAIDEVPVTVFAKGAFYARKEIGQLNCQSIGLDWNMGIESSRKLVGDKKVLQGNLDPCLLYASHETIKEKTEDMLRSFGAKNHIANLGHGLYPDTEKEKAKFFVDVVKSFKH